MSELPESGVLVIYLQMKPHSADYRNRIQLKASLIDHHGNLVSFSISRFFIAIRYRLAAQLVSPESSFYDAENRIWFKDESGKEKSLELQINLEDFKGQLVRNSQLPLSFLLFYEDGEEVVERQVRLLSFHFNYILISLMLSLVF